MESIKQFGFAQPLVVDKNDVLIIGHCRLIAAKRLKMTKVPVLRMEDLTEEQAAKLRLLDNKLNESEWDLDLLAEEIEGLDFDGFCVDWEIPEVEEQLEVEEDEPPAPNMEAEPMTKEGDIYQLGDHRLICGDSTKPETIQKLLDGEKVDLLITDPPYNVALGYHMTPEEAKRIKRRTDGLIIENDEFKNDAEFVKFLKKSRKKSMLRRFSWKITFPTFILK
jgi:site-specific DNA-methyltransferase (adenine-specific)